MHKLGLLLCLFICCFTKATADNGQYATSLLRQLASDAGYVPSSHLNDSIPHTFRGLPLAVEVGNDRVVRHLGIKLFNADMFHAASRVDSMAMRFMERYALELITLHNVNAVDKKADDKVFFRQGNLSVLTHNALKCKFSLLHHPNYFEARWTSDNKNIVTLVFPPNVELICGATLVELQNGMQEELKSTPSNPLPTREWNEEELVDKGDNLWASNAKYYELKALNDVVNLYKDGKGFQPIFSEKHLDYSATNLALGTIPQDYRMAVEQNMYGFQKKSYLVNLSQWLNYCIANGLKLYVSVEEERTDGLKLFVLAVNKDFGYNHVMSLIVPSSFIKNKACVLKAKLTVFVPTDNVKNLYQNYVRHAKKKINYE